MSRFFFTLLIATLLAAPFVVFLGVVSAENAPPTATTPTYQRLAPLPEPTITVGEGLSGYLKTLFWLAISAAGVLAVLMITVGGVQYMVSEAFNTKAEAKNRITMAIFGFLLAISSVLILQTINPTLLNFKLTIDALPAFKIQSETLAEGSVPGCTTFIGQPAEYCQWVSLSGLSNCFQAVQNTSGPEEAKNWTDAVGSACASDKPEGSQRCCVYAPPSNGCSGSGLYAGKKACGWSASPQNATETLAGVGVGDTCIEDYGTMTQVTNNFCAGESKGFLSECCANAF